MSIVIGCRSAEVDFHFILLEWLGVARSRTVGAVYALSFERNRWTVAARAMGRIKRENR